MKTWQNVEIVELDINMTAQGGANKNMEDANWTDQNGALWTSHGSGVYTGPVDGDITVSQ